jgi:hypothetical protein
MFRDFSFMQMEMLDMIEVDCHTLLPYLPLFPEGRLMLGRRLIVVISFNSWQLNLVLFIYILCPINIPNKYYYCMSV